MIKIPKISLTPCNDYDYNATKTAITQNIAHLGGFAPYINPGERVLLKINMLMKKSPNQATTTHPTFVRALSDLLLEYGCKVMIGDSPGGPFSEGYLRGIYKVTGMEEISKETSATLNANFKQTEKELPCGKLLKRLTITDMLNDVDKVISVSKLKTHGMMTFTGAVKNMFGIIPGLIKMEYHLNMPEHSDFADMLIDVCECAEPVLSFMDGIVGMEGAGPSAGNPRKIGVCIASDSPYALDMAACSIINLDFDRVPTIVQSQKRGLSPASLNQAEMLGNPISDFAVTDFEIPETKIVSVPKNPLLAGITNKFLQPRPKFLKNLCIGCGDCERLCPAKVIKIENKFPCIELKNCIRCFCCQELCPKKAVEIHRPRFLKFLSRL
ncbi:MAG: DUF362 domain-containing protein [Defluviitaleaceae bacterium]|nr:DUF362 domain-containing protein [Defluviitaleaceae bacterium]